MSKRLLALCACAMAMQLSACAPTTQSPNVTNEMAANEAQIQREMAVKEIMKYTQRLQNVARPIMMANAELCPDSVGTYKGFITATAAEIAPREYKETYARLYGVEERPTVVLLVEKSGIGDKLKIGDVITKVDGFTVGKGARGNKGLREMVSNHKLDHPLNLTIERNGKTKEVSLTPQPACTYALFVEQHDSVNAAADGDNIVVTTGMMRFTKTDNELALVIGHELAHNTREHIKSRQGNAVLGAVLGAVVTVATGIDVTQLGSDIGTMAYAQSFESEADYVGLYHTARGGYAIGSAPEFWRRVGANHPAGIHIGSGTHPSSAARYVALDQAVKEIQGKRANKIALLPEEKKREDIEPAGGDGNKDGLND